MNVSPFIFFFASCVWFLSVVRPCCGHIIWLELGTAQQAVLNASNLPLTKADLLGLGSVVVNDQGVEIGAADLNGLDEVGDGHLLGIIHLGDLSTAQVSLKVTDGAAQRQTILGNGTASADDFVPALSLATYRIGTASLTWQTVTRRRLTTFTEGYGQVSPASGDFDDAAEIVLTATPAGNQQFIRWLSPGGIVLLESITALTVTMDRDRTIQALFGSQVPDGWRSQFGLPLTESLELDRDLDGFTDRQEFERGSDPTVGGFAASEDLDLTTGWNLVVLRVQPAPTIDWTDLLPGGPDARAWWWNPFLSQWRQDGAIRARRGYWIHATAPSNPRIEGQGLTNSWIDLLTGWNLLGVGQSTLLEGESDIGSIYWSYDPASRRFHAHDRSLPLTPTSGYWVHSAADRQFPE